LLGRRSALLYDFFIELTARVGMLDGSPSSSISEAMGFAKPEGRGKSLTT
jgi:hypothetical protein